MGRILLVVAMVVACGKVNTPDQNQCESPRSTCGTSCVDEQTDPANCGACGSACNSTQTCTAGHCVMSCDTGLSACTTGCVDEQTDPMNCGACGSACAGACAGAACQPLGYFKLTGTPNPATVFNTIAETYAFPNNLSNSIWHRPSNKILTGYFSTAGFWEFAEGTNNYATAPDHATPDVHGRMVFMPATNTVVYTSASGIGPGTHDQIMVATLDTTGTLSAGVAAVFSDNFTGVCQLFSASATQLLCFDGSVIRRYNTMAGAHTLTFVDSVSLSTALPATAACVSACYGGTFAFDGMFYYFATVANGMSGNGYIAYDVTGAFVNNYTGAAGGGDINSAYFDWSVGRYSVHDGFGAHSGGVVYTSTAGPGDDTHAFSSVSTAHTLQ